MELYDEARSRRKERRAEELRAREMRFQRLSPIIEETLAVCRSWAEGVIDRETAQRKLWEVCPDEETQMEVIEFLWPILEERLDMTAEEWAAQRVERGRALEAGKEELLKSTELLAAAEQARLALEVVSRQVLAGEKQAIEDAASIAEQAITLLMVAEKMHPEAARKVATFRMHWPLLGSREPGWAVPAAERMESLRLGTALECLQTRFRQPRGANENHPARLWAGAAVRVLEETRHRWTLYAGFREEFEKLILEGGIVCAESPPWVDAALKLQAFSASSARKWGKVIRDMIRSQVPHFHTAPEWSNQRNNAKSNCRDSRGEIQNAILDDIVSALLRIAPSAKLPKSDC